jgi:hypothetical protein
MAEDDYVYGDGEFEERPIDYSGNHPVALVKEDEPLDEMQVKSILSHEIEDALGGLGSQVNEERIRALRFYYGREFGNEVDGRSKVILTDVADTIEWILPSLMRMFTGGQYIARFLPRGPDDVEGCEQATEYINQTFMNENRGFQVLHDWFKDALLEKNGIVKTYYEERLEPKVETYRGLTGSGVQLLLQDNTKEPIAFDQREDGTYDIRIRQRVPVGQIKIDLVPPEEFLIARRTIELNDATAFTAHRKKVTVSDLIALGFDRDIVTTLPSDDTPEYTEGRIERLTEDESFPVTTAERADPASREIWTTECYVRLDEDGDGYAELRKITVVGEQSITILEDIEINNQPFTSITPIPMPHKFFGLSIADQVSDLQVIRSTLLRQMLDNMYLVNNGRFEVVDGAVEIDDLLTSRPGGIVRVTAPGMVNPLPTQPFNQVSFHMMEFLEGVRTMRTGAGQHNQGLDASSFANTTATGVSQMMSASYARIELIARIFAEGVRDLFRKQLKLMIANPVQQRVIRMRGKWVEIDPSTWNAEMDCEVQVGLGVGQSQERIGFLMQVLQLQGEMATRGLDTVTQQNSYNAAVKLMEAMGLRNAEMYFTDPNDKPAEPPPDPDLQAEQLKSRQREEESKRRERDNRQEVLLGAEELKVKLMNDKVMDNFRQKELAQKAELERERLAMQERISKIQADATTAVARINDDNDDG